MSYRGRFAPTPSGPLHFGSIIAASGSFLEARTRSGQWHVRIDDLDPPRVVAGATEDIVRCLQAFGFRWDDQIVKQSARGAAYRHAFERLLREGIAYPCACSRKEIAERGVMGAEGPIYPGTCRNGMPPGASARAWRMRTTGVRVEFEDRVLGLQRRDLERESGDFVLLRADGVWSFHLASAVDDAQMGMTDIVRGADLLESSARQIHVLLALGEPVPTYAHLPIARDAAGEKLSKQTRAPAVDPARAGEVLVDALRFLGQPVPDGLSRADLHAVWQWALDNWDLRRVRREALPIRAG
jgi:glutamyl-Q tRNA(Asp) synthetase